MSQQRLRLIVFGLWIGCWVLSTAAIAFAPTLRSDDQIGREQVVPLVTTVTGVWLPAVTCLAAFWFPESERKRAAVSKVTKERTVAALTVTVLYVGFVLAMLLNDVYGIDYAAATASLPCPPAGSTIDEQVMSVVKLALLVSPVALAPINWLTRRTGS